MIKIQLYNKEIRLRLFSVLLSFIFTFIILYTYSIEYIWFLTKPVYLLDKSNVNKLRTFDGLHFQCTEISEAFKTYVSVAFGLSFLFLFRFFHKY